MLYSQMGMQLSENPILWRQNCIVMCQPIRDKYYLETVCHQAVGDYSQSPTEAGWICQILTKIYS